jgi:hypothetical protein
MEKGYDERLSVVVVRIGQIGHSHAFAYHHNAGFRIVGLVSRSPVKKLPDILKQYPILSSFEEALALKPNVVSINTHTATHAAYAVAAMESGAHFLLKSPWQRQSLRRSASWRRHDVRTASWSSATSYGIIPAGSSSFARLGSSVHRSSCG